jgi:hypothetical protein
MGANLSPRIPRLTGIDDNYLYRFLKSYFMIHVSIGIRGQMGCFGGGKMGGSLGCSFTVYFMKCVVLVKISHLS